MHVLIVDDEPAACDAMARVLTQLGYASTLALTGERALTIMREQHPDAVMLDLRLGARSIAGREVWERKVLDPTIRGIPVLVVTGMVESSPDAHQAVVGMTLVVGKPVSGVMLRAALRQLIGDGSAAATAETA